MRETQGEYVERFGGVEFFSLGGGGGLALQGTQHAALHCAQSVAACLQFLNRSSS